ncbi:MAG: hypothetical protein GTN38_04455 [Candidatus Aenigmarchaeota archaeon]|nr:hypothetical protein [Candidatus Aenigmarchaeota archaeon]NIQ17402.1 hypothetical protein [Candidatus Aenigmarchaeota archaeon]
MTRSIGLGPFKFKAWKAGSYIQLLKNALFFGREQEIAGRELTPFIEGVIFKIYDSQGGTTSALEKGAIDFLWKGISHGFMRDLMKNPDIKVHHTLDNGYRYLTFNHRKGPLCRILHFVKRWPILSTRTLSCSRLCSSESLNNRNRY